MAAGVTYNAISSQTLSTSSNLITLNSFSGYTDLRIVMSFFTTGPGVETLQFNGSAGSAYEQMQLNAFTAATSGGVAGYNAYNLSGRGNFLTYGGWTQNGTTTPAIMEFYIPLYANTDSYHYVFGTYGSGQAQTTGTYYEHDLWQGQWKSSAAITSMTISNDSYAFAAGTVVSVYGISEA